MCGKKNSRRAESGRILCQHNITSCIEQTLPLHVSFHNFLSTFPTLLFEAKVKSFDQLHNIVFCIAYIALFSLNQILCHHNITSMKHPLSLRLVDTKFTMFAVEQGLFEVLDLNFILVWFEGIT